jgi:phospholipase C
VQPIKAVFFAVLVPLAGCSGPNTSGSVSVACRPITVTAADRSTDWSGTVFTIVMENHSRDGIIGNAAAPYINGLAQQNALAGGYHDSYVHPSEPNYLWMVAGENFGILNDNDPGPANTIASRSHIADQVEQAGLSWRSYQESMGQPCGLKSHDMYAVKHNPFAYFDDINGYRDGFVEPTARCQEHVVDYSEFDADLAAGRLPNYVFITPNLMHDMHDGTVADGDAWAAREIPKILASDAYNRGGVLFLLWDEGNNDSDSPPFIAVSPRSKHGYVSHTPYDTSSYLLTVQQILGLDPLPCSSSPDAVHAMGDLFTVPLPPAMSSDGGV